MLCLLHINTPPALRKCVPVVTLSHSCPSEGGLFMEGAPFTCWVLIRPLCDRAEGAVNDPATELDVCTGREVCYSSSPPKSCPVTATWEARRAGGCGGKRDQKPNMGLGRLAWCPGCGKGSFQPPSCTVRVSVSSASPESCEPAFSSVLGWRSLIGVSRPSS